jgi:hypothetical protein
VPHRPTGGRTPVGTASRPATVPAFADDLNPTGELVVHLWEETADAPPLEGWMSADPLSSVPERNPIRFVSLGLIGAAAAAVVLAIGLLFGSIGSDSETLSSEAEALAAAITAFDVAAVTPDFSAMDTAARRVLNAADALEVGDPDRAVAIDAAGRVLDVERTLSDALSYETGFVVFVGRPALPNDAREDELSDVSGEFTSWVTDFRRVLDSAPAERAFADHSSAIATFEAGIGQVQAAYLDALRAGDDVAAVEQLAIVDEMVGELQRSMAAAVTGSERASRSSLEQVTTMLARLAEPD